MVYPDKFRIDVVAYAAKNGVEKAASQFGVSSFSVKNWTTKLSETCPENSSDDTPPTAKSGHKKTHAKSHRYKLQRRTAVTKKKISNQFDNELTRWLLTRINNGNRPTLQEISLKGRKIAQQTGKSLYIPTKSWASSFLRRVNLEEKWKKSYRTEKAKLTTAKEKAARLLIEFVREQIANETSICLNDISKKGLEFEQLTGAKRHKQKHGAAWSWAFLKRVGLLDDWRVSRGKWCHSRLEKAESKEVKANRLLAEWIRKRLATGPLLSLIDISTKGLEIEKRIGTKQHKHYCVWGWSFLKRAGLLTKWKMHRKIWCHAHVEKERFTLLLTRWIIERLTNGPRLSLNEISLKAFEIKEMTRTKRHKHSAAWSLAFLRRVGLLTRWRDDRKQYHTHSEMTETPTKYDESTQTDLEAPASDFQQYDLDFMDEVLAYAESHGNQVAAIKYDIPEKVFYEYLVSDIIKQRRPLLIDSEETRPSMMEIVLKYAECYGKEKTADKFQIPINVINEHLTQDQETHQ